MMLRVSVKPACALPVDGQYYFSFKGFADCTPRAEGYWLASGKAANSGWVYFRSKRVTLCKSGAADRSLILLPTNLRITQLN